MQPTGSGRINITLRKPPTDILKVYCAGINSLMKLGISKPLQNTLREMKTVTVAAASKRNPTAQNTQRHKNTRRILFTDSSLDSKNLGNVSRSSPVQINIGLILKFVKCFKIFN